MTGPWYRWEGDDLLLHLRVQPRGGSDRFIEPHDDRYKVRITAPPVDGKANAHLLRFLARAFGVPRNRVALLSGETSRNKTFRIEKPCKYPIPLTKP